MASVTASAGSTPPGFSSCPNRIISPRVAMLVGAQPGLAPGSQTVPLAPQIPRTNEQA